MPIPATSYDQRVEKRLAEERIFWPTALRGH